MPQKGMGFAENYKALIQRAVESRFAGKPSRLAKAAGVHIQNVTRLLKGERKSWLASMGLIADAAGVQIIAGDEVKESEYSFIPKAKAKPSAGGDSLETGGETEQSFAFRREWLREKTICLDELKVMVVVGPSMSPTIDDGDIVLVDESEPAKELVEGRVYVLRLGDEIFVKRYFARKVPKMHYFKGDNRSLAHQDLEISPDDESVDWQSIGRVLWAGKEL